MIYKKMDKDLKHSEKKAYEIAYALFRIAEIVKNRNIAEYLEGGAMRHLKSVILMDFNSAVESSRELEFYLRIGQDLNFIHPENAQAVIAELRGLNEHLAELQGRTKLPNVLRLGFSGKEPVPPVKGRETLQDIKLSLDSINKQIEILSENDQLAEDDEVMVETAQKPASEAEVPEKKFGLKIERQSSVVGAEEIPAEDYKLNIFNGETRQMAIYEAIRQFGKESGNGCRMRDLQESFSGVSERTIRYDLEKLMEMGLIERAGQSGPGTYYRVKKISPSLV
jgi:DNA-binding transcriptional ArsR family regulator